MQEWLILGAAMLATGCVAGTLAGLFGIGGGIVIVPVLEGVLGVLGVDPSIRMHIAVATSLATIIPTSMCRRSLSRRTIETRITAGGVSGEWPRARSAYS